MTNITIWISDGEYFSDPKINIDKNKVQRTYLKKLRDIKNIIIKNKITD